MSFFAKTDLVGLSSAFDSGKLQVRSNNDNKSWTLVNVPGSDGSFLGEYHDGEIKNPSCDYVVCSDLTFSGIELGKCYNGVYALQHIHISSAPGVERVITADAVQIETGSTQAYCTYVIPTLTLSPARHALTFDAFTYTQGVALTLQSCEYDASIDLSPSTINGNPVASDAVHGIITVTPTFWTTSDSSAPSVTMSSGWNLTSPFTCTGQDSTLFNWTCTYTKYLTVKSNA